MADYYIDINGNVSTDKKKKKKLPNYIVDIDGNVTDLKKTINDTVWSGIQERNQERNMVEVNLPEAPTRSVTTNLPTANTTSEILLPTVNNAQKQKKKANIERLKTNQSEEVKKYQELQNKKGTITRELPEKIAKKISEMEFIKTPEAFKDGYQFGDVTKTILGTPAYIGGKLLQGTENVLEGVKQLGKGLINTTTSKILGIEPEALDFVSNEIEAKNKIGSGIKAENITDATEKYSIVGKTLGEIIEGVGYSGTLGLAETLGGPVAMNLLTFGSATGNAYTEAMQNKEATNAQVWAKAIGSGSIETLTENLFGLFGRTGLDDKVANSLAKQASTGIEKALIRNGIMMGSEASEEIISATLNHWLDLKIDEVSQGEGAQFAKDIDWEEVAHEAFIAASSAGLMGAGSTYANVNQTVKENQVGIKEALDIYERRLDTQAEIEKQKSLLEKQKTNLEKTIKQEQKKGNDTTELQNEVAQINNLLGIEQKQEQVDINNASQSNISDLNNQVQQVSQESTKQVQNQVQEQIEQQEENTQEKYQKILDEAKYIPQNEKNELLKSVNTETSLEDFKNFVNDMNNNYKVEEDKILNKSFDRQTYGKYTNQDYDNTIVEKAKEIVPANKQGKRTKEQWLNVAKQIGVEIADNSNSEIEKIAYKSWQEEAPNQKSQLNRQGKGFVKFTAEEWLNAIYDSVKNVRNQQENNVENISNVRYNISESESDNNVRKQKENDRRRLEGLFEIYREGEEASKRYDKALLGIQNSRDVTKERLKQEIIDYANKYKKTILTTQEKQFKDILNNIDGDVAFYDIGDKNGFIGLSDGKTLYIDTASKEKLENVFYHELTHYLRQNKNSIYMNEIQPIVDEISADETFNGYMQKLVAELEDIRDIEGLTADSLAEEVIANTISSIYGDYEANYKIPKETVETIKLAMDKILKNSEKGSFNLPVKEEANLPVAEQTELQDENKKQRKHYKSIMQSSNMTKEAKKIAKELMGSDTYYPDSNKRQLQRADQSISNNTPDGELNKLTGKINDGDKITATDIAIGERLIQYYSKIGDSERLQEAIQNTAMMGTELGQAVQAMAILNHQTPVGQVSWIDRSVRKMNNDILNKKHLTIDDNGRIINSKGQDVTNKTQLFNFTADMQQRILNSTSETMNDVLDDVYAELGDQVAKDLQGQIDAWRYFAMLGNLKTHGRNILGNVGMGTIQSLKDMVAGGIEDVVAKFNPDMERTKSLTKFVPTAEMINYAKNDIKNVKNELGIGSDKYNPQSRLQQNMRTFKSDILEKTVGTMFDLNTNLLEVEDGVGLKFNYVKALSQYMSANKLTPSTITEKQLAQARKYAIQQAQEATFHQANSLATAINQFSKNKLGKAFTASILPFVKTPLNVAKAGLEYNPVGLVYSAVKGVHDLRNNNITVNQYIDNVSKGLTGTGIATLGYALAKAGLLKASGGDDDKDKYDEEQGKQAYSIQICGQTYTLDWLAPTAIPLFVGAEAYDIVNKGEEEKTAISSDDDKLINKITKSGSNLLSAGLSSMNPMTEMSMLSGLASFISSYEQDSNQKLATLGTNAMKSYVNQFVPTLLSQVAKTSDEYQRKTATTKTGMLEKPLDQLKNQIMSKIPGLRENLPIATDVWGNELKQPENIGQRAVENMILPYTRKNITTTETDEALNELYDETGSKSVLPTGIDKTFTIEGQKYRLTNAEYAKYSKEYGQNSFDLISKLTSSDDYNSLTTEEQQKAIEKIYSYAKEINKVDYADENDIYIETSSLYDIMEDLKENGGSQVDYLEYYVKSSGYTDSEKNQLLYDSDFSNKTKSIIYEDTTGKNDEFYPISGINIDSYLDYKANVNKLEADKDSNGNSISGSKKEKVIKYVDNIKGLSATQKAILIRKAGYTSFDNYNPEIISYVNNLDITRAKKEEYLKQLGFTVESGKITW